MKTFKISLLGLILLFAATTLTNAQGVSEPFDLISLSSTAAEDIINTNAQIEIQNHISKKLVYPSQMEEFGIEGSSTVKIKIDQQGKIKSHIILNSIGQAFDHAISASLKKLKYVSPVFVNGAAQDYTIVVPVRFEL